MCTGCNDQTFEQWAAELDAENPNYKAPKGRHGDESLPASFGFVMLHSGQLVDPTSPQFEHDLTTVAQMANPGYEAFGWTIENGRWVRPK